MRVIVSLEEQSRFPRPSVGRFIWHPEFERLVWENSPATDVSTLVRQVNEAVTFIREAENPYLVMKVIEVAEVQPQEPSAPPAEPPQEPEPQPQQRLKLSPKTQKRHE